MDKYTVQYLIGFDYKVPYCKSQKAYWTLVSSIDGVVLGTTKIKYKDTEISFKIKTIDKKDEKIKYYDVSYTIKSDDDIEVFTSFLSNHNSLMYNVASKDMETLWNDISLYYSLKSYPLIHDIENLMRNLITKFMILKVDSDWIDLKVPEKVKKSLKGNINKKSDYLYEVDFIQLSDFLFNKYPEKNITNLYDEIEKSQENLKREDLLQYVPKSNWDRYFSNIVECEGEYILKRWNTLYELRCKIAHNKIVIKKDYERITCLIKEVKEKLEKALENLAHITISIEEKEEISVNFAITKNEQFSTFLKSYTLLQNQIFDSVNKNMKFTSTYYNMIKITDSINKIQSYFPKLPEETLEIIKSLQGYRNRIVHQYDSIIDNDEINEKIEKIKKITNELTMIKDQEIDIDNKEEINKKSEESDDES